MSGADELIVVYNQIGNGAASSCSDFCTILNYAALVTNTTVVTTKVGYDCGTSILDAPI